MVALEEEEAAVAEAEAEIDVMASTECSTPQRHHHQEQLKADVISSPTGTAVVDASSSSPSSSCSPSSSFSSSSSSPSSLTNAKDICRSSCQLDGSSRTESIASATVFKFEMTDFNILCLAFCCSSA
jgi:hypothetical protein